MKRKATTTAECLGAPFLDVDHVAEHVDVSTRTVRRWIKGGELVAHRLGRSLRISPDDLLLFLQKRRG